MRAFHDEYGVEMIHGWGMTEMSPVGTVSQLKAKHRGIWPARSGVALQHASRAAPSSASISRSSMARGASCRGTARVRRSPGAGPVDRERLLQRARLAPARRLVPHRRRRDDRSRRLHQDHRPLQGRDQERRRVDQLDRAREHRRGAPRRRRGGRHRHQGTRNGTSGRCWSCSAARARSSTRDELLGFYAGKVAKWWVPDDVVFVDRCRTPRPASS